MVAPENDDGFLCQTEALQCRQEPSDLGLDGRVGAAASVAHLSAYRMPPSRPGGRILEGALADQVKDLVRLLREEAKVL